MCPVGSGPTTSTKAVPQAGAGFPAIRRADIMPRRRALWEGPDLLLVHAYIEVSDLERGIEFYCRGIGLVLKRRISPTWVELTGANLPMFLLGRSSPSE